MNSAWSPGASSPRKASPITTPSRATTAPTFGETLPDSLSHWRANAITRSISVRSSLAAELCVAIPHDIYAYGCPSHRRVDPRSGTALSPGRSSAQLRPRVDDSLGTGDSRRSHRPCLDDGCPRSWCRVLGDRGAAGGGSPPIRTAVSTRRRAVGSYHWFVIELRVTVPEETAERLASEAADRGTSAEVVAAEVLNEHAPSPRKRSLPFIAMFEAPKGALYRGRGRTPSRGRRRRKLRTIVVVDTGPLVATAIRRDPDHQACVAFFEQVSEPFVIPAARDHRSRPSRRPDPRPSAEASFIRQLAGAVGQLPLQRPSRPAPYGRAHGHLRRPTARDRRRRCHRHCRVTRRHQDRHLGPQALHRRAPDPRVFVRAVSLTAARASPNCENLGDGRPRHHSRRSSARAYCREHAFARFASNVRPDALVHEHSPRSWQVTYSPHRLAVHDVVERYHDLSGGSTRSARWTREVAAISRSI